MLEVQGQSILFYAFYTEGGAGDTGLTVSVDVYEVTRAGSATLIVDDGSATEIGGGLYRYLLASGSVDAAAEYIAIFHTSDGDTDQQDIPAMWVIDRANVADIDAILTDTGTTLPGSLTTIEGKIDSVDGHVDEILTDTGSTLPGVLSTIEGKVDTLDGIVDAVLVDTGTDLPASIAAVQADLDNPDQFKADVTGLALEATLAAIKGAGWTDETLIALKDAIDAISVSGASAQEVWEYTSRTLTQSAKEIIAAVSGSSITQIRGNSWTIAITDLTLDTHKQQFAFKRSVSDEDDQAYLLIDSDSGLLIVNGAAAANPAKASLSYVGTTLTVTVDEAITALMPARDGVYGIQSVTAGGVVIEAYNGRFTVMGDVVRAVE